MLQTQTQTQTVEAVPVKNKEYELTDVQVAEPSTMITMAEATEIQVESCLPKVAVEDRYFGYEKKRISIYI